MGTRTNNRQCRERKNSRHFFIARNTTLINDVKANIIYREAAKKIKDAILQSRYRTTQNANRELLNLYHNVGGYISTNTRDGKWGTGTIESISAQLQHALNEIYTQYIHDDALRRGAEMPNSASRSEASDFETFCTVRAGRGHAARLCRMRQ